MKYHLKKKVRDVLITFFTVSGITWWYRMFHSSPVRIIVFHHIHDADWFESLIFTLSKSFQIISPKMLAKESIHTKSIQVVISFDDGYASWVEIALPILKKYGIEALFFVNSGIMNTARNPHASEAFMREKLMVNPKEPLTWEGLTTIAKANHSIGGHSTMHEDLTQISPETVRKEIDADKKAIEEKLGMQLTEFAYPFGTRHHSNTSVVDAVKSAGYLRAYTAIPGFYIQDDNWQIPRMCIESDMTPSELKKWIYGAYDIFDRLKNICVR